MTRAPGTRGTGLVELIVGTALALIVLSCLTAAVGTGGRLLAASGARGEAEDTVQLAIEAFVFDARRAGWDPAAAGVAAVTEAAADRVAFAADLDGDGTVDLASEESAAYVCAGAAGRLSRIIGRQSLPLADGVTGCGFRYFDLAGTPLAVPGGGLDAAARASIGAIALDLVLLPTALRGRAERTVAVALRRRA